MVRTTKARSMLLGWVVALGATASCRTGELPYRPPAPGTAPVFEVVSTGRTDLDGRLARGLAAELQERGLPTVVVEKKGMSRARWTVGVNVMSAADSTLMAGAKVLEATTGEVLYEGTVTASSGALMSEEKRLQRCAASAADQMARLIATQYETEVALGKAPGKRLALPHARRVFVTRNPLPADSYEVVEEIQVGKTWYGATDTVLNALARYAQKKGADAVIEVETWFRPTWLALVAPQARGKAVLFRDPCQFESFRVDGEFLPRDEEWGGTGDPITEVCQRERAR